MEGHSPQKGPRLAEQRRVLGAQTGEKKKNTADRCKKKKNLQRNAPIGKTKEQGTAKTFKEPPKRPYSKKWPNKAPDWIKERVIEKAKKNAEGDQLRTTTNRKRNVDQGKSSVQSSTVAKQWREQKRT